MWSCSNRRQKEPEKREGGLGSHNLPKKLSEKTASTHQSSDAAGPQPSIMVTPATPQPGNTSQTRPATSASELTLVADSLVVMLSPHRTYKEDGFPPTFFSKDMLIEMKHNKHHLDLDLFRPEGAVNVFPPQDLAPLCLFRDLRSLKITGMMQSYQWNIWLVVWLNPQLTDLTLEMAGEAEPLDIIAIAEAQKYAECKPTMREVAQGKTRAEFPEKFQIVNLSLTNFVMHDAPFEWFDNTKLQRLKLHRCKDAGFQLPIIMERSFNITLTV